MTAEWEILSLFLVFYGLYFLNALREIFIFYSPSLNETDVQNKLKKGNRPLVAIFHTVCNDFNLPSLCSLINIKYTHKTIFLLDDTRDDRLKYILPSLIENTRCCIKYLHRGRRNGFKAGNLNFGLSSIDSRYKYIFLADSDQRVPTDF